MDLIKLLMQIEFLEKELSLIKNEIVNELSNVPTIHQKTRKQKIDMMAKELITKWTIRDKRKAINMRGGPNRV